MPSFVGPSVRRLARLGIALVPFAVVAIAGCGDDNGVDPLRPERGIVGRWVRYQPTPKGSLPVALPRTIDDTLFLANDGTGVWSRENLMSAGIQPLRMTNSVQLRSLGPRLVLFTLATPCPACEVMTADQRLSSPTLDESYRVYRTDVDHLIIVPTGATTQLGSAYYVRQPIEMSIEM